MNQSAAPSTPKPQSKAPNSPSDIAKIAIMIGLGIIGLYLEARGVKSGQLKYLAIVVVLLVALTGLSGFTDAYNRLWRTQGATEVRNRLKFSAEKASAFGVVSLTFGVALGIYNLDATNSEANFYKLHSVQMQMMQKTKRLGCKFTADEPERDCRSLHDALNILWKAVLASDIKGMTEGVESVRQKWLALGARWPHPNLDEFIATTEGLDELQYRLDKFKPELALFLAALLLPLSIAATSRKLAVAAFEAKFSDGPVTWRMVSKRALFSVFRAVLPWKWRSESEAVKIDR